MVFAQNTLDIPGDDETPRVDQHSWGLFPGFCMHILFSAHQTEVLEMIALSLKSTKPCVLGIVGQSDLLPILARKMCLVLL